MTRPACTVSGRCGRPPPTCKQPPFTLVLMRLAFAIALGLLVITAVAGTAVAISGATEAASLIWTAGGIASAIPVFLAPWLIHFLTSGEDPDAG